MVAYVKRQQPLERLIDYEDDVLRFMTDACVPFIPITIYYNLDNRAQWAGVKKALRKDLPKCIS